MFRTIQKNIIFINFYVDYNNFDVDNNKLSILNVYLDCSILSLIVVLIW